MSEAELLLDFNASELKERRSETLEPDLINNEYAENWAFRIPACFKDAVDITWDTRVERKIKRNTWTQGSNFRFAAGDVLYDTPQAYQIWKEALKHITTSLKVLHATPASLGSTGQVEFTASHPKTGIGLVEGGTYQCSQEDFVALLKTGFLDGKAHANL